MFANTHMYQNSYQRNANTTLQKRFNLGVDQLNHDIKPRFYFRMIIMRSLSVLCFDADDSDCNIIVTNVLSVI